MTRAREATGSKPKSLIDIYRIVAIPDPSSLNCVYKGTKRFPLKAFPVYAQSHAGQTDGERDVPVALGMGRLRCARAGAARRVWRLAHTRLSFPCTLDTRRAQQPAKCASPYLGIQVCPCMRIDLARTCPLPVGAITPSALEGDEAFGRTRRVLWHSVLLLMLVVR